MLIKKTFIKIQNQIIYHLNIENLKFIKNRLAFKIRAALKWIFIPVVSSSIMVFLPYILGLIGLSSIGPIAGGLFSTMQGAGIVSGSFMAMIQSFAMSGYIVVIQLVGISGWVGVSIYTLIKQHLYH
jgi:hypothetical protein